MQKNATIPLVFSLLILVASIGIIGLDAGHWKRVSDQEMRWFQNLTGGLGMGAVVTPSWSVIDFDPRLQPLDESTLRPFPGGYSYSPTGASSVTSFKEILSRPGEKK